MKWKVIISQIGLYKEKITWNFTVHPILHYIHFTLQPFFNSSNLKSEFERSSILHFIHFTLHPFYNSSNLHIGHYSTHPCTKTTPKSIPVLCTAQCTLCVYSIKTLLFLLTEQGERGRREVCIEYCIYTVNTVLYNSVHVYFKEYSTVIALCTVHT